MSQGRQAVPYYRLSSFYFFYFFSIGIFVPYWSVYLQGVGFGPRQIGELIAISLATKFFAPYLWGWIADHTGKRLEIIRLTCFLAAASFALIFFGQGYWWLVLIVALFSFFWHGVLPQFEATTLNYLGEERARYGRIRLWGSIGFIVAVMAFGAWIDLKGVQALPMVMMATMAMIWVSTLLVKASPASPEVHNELNILTALRKPEVIALLSAAALLQMSHGPYYTFFSIYLEDYGYSGTAIGQFWALGVVAEIGVFLLVHRMFPAFGIVRLFQLSLAITVLRWVLISLFADSFWVLFVAQLMHAASYGLFHATAIELINRYFPGRLQGRGQALYGSISFGLGNALGSLASGYLWQGVGAEETFLLASVVCFVGFVISLFVLQPRSKAIGR